jgi:hypothetical protein
MPIRPEEKPRYPPDWPHISQWVKSARAHWRCECEGECGLDHSGRCLALHGDPISLDNPKPIVLTTAHLDHQPENCDLSNLKAMCPRCHNKYDAKHRAETRRLKRMAERAAWMTSLFTP